MSTSIEYDRDANPGRRFNTAKGVEIVDDTDLKSAFKIQSGTDSDGFYIDVGWDAGPNNSSLEDSMDHALETISNYYAALNRVYVRFEGHSALQDETHEFGSQEIQTLLDSDDKVEEAKNLAGCAMTPVELTAAPKGKMEDILFRYRSNDQDGYSMQSREMFGRDQAELIASSQGYDPENDEELIDAMTEALQNNT